MPLLLKKKLYDMFNCIPFAAIICSMRLKGLSTMPSVFCLKQSLTACFCLEVDGPRLDGSFENVQVPCQSQKHLLVHFRNPLARF